MATKLLTVEEAGDRLSLAPATIRKMLYRGELPRVRPTKRAVRIPEAAVEALARHGFTPGVPRPVDVNGIIAEGFRPVRPDLQPPAMKR
jgi:excisionase family DNA binding protein